MINSLSTDYIIRLKNASLAGDKHVKTPNSKFLRAITDLLVKNGFLKSYEVAEDNKSLTIELVYDNNFPKIGNVKIFSKPGRRWYGTTNALPWGQTPDSLIIVSTSKGLLTQKQAKKSGLGGEIIAEIW